MLIYINTESAIKLGITDQNLIRKSKYKSCQQSTPEGDFNLQYQSCEGDFELQFVDICLNLDINVNIMHSFSLIVHYDVIRL